MPTECEITQARDYATDCAAIIDGISLYLAMGGRIDATEFAAGLERHYQDLLRAANKLRRALQVDGVLTALEVASTGARIEANGKLYAAYSRATLQHVDRALDVLRPEGFHVFPGWCELLFDAYRKGDDDPEGRDLWCLRDEDYPAYFEAVRKSQLTTMPEGWTERIAREAAGAVAALGADDPHVLLAQGKIALTTVQRDIYDELSVRQFTAEGLERRFEKIRANQRGYSIRNLKIALKILKDTHHLIDNLDDGEGYFLTNNPPKPTALRIAL